MDRIKFNWGGLLLALTTVGLGIMVLANPSRALNAAKLLISAALFGGGLLKCCEYFADDPKGASFLFGNLTYGITLIALGVMLNTKAADKILSVTMVIGYFVLLTGFGGIEAAATAWRKGEKSTVLRTIYAVLTVAAGIILLTYQFSTDEKFALFTGAALLIEGTLLIAVVIQSYISGKKDKPVKI